MRFAAAAAALASSLLLAGVGSAAAPPLQAELARFASAHPTFPGAALAVRTPSLTWIGAAGKLSPHSTFRIASVTKTFTAAATLRLVEDGRIDLDAPIARYLSPTTLGLLRDGGYDVDAIHVRHLLTHTSGLYDYA